MAKFGKSSYANLRTCNPRLITLFEEIVVFFDCSILKGHRGEAAQNKAYDEGNSQLRWPDGKHNAYPSNALDAAPYPYDDTDRERMTLFAGVVIGYARAKGITLRWGGDWDRDTEVSDNNFDDLFHFEIVE
jgi:hypothetical protein